MRCHKVPSASVRAEKNRCARNCFLCPLCRNTLSVVPSDPPEPEDPRLSPIATSTIGEPPFFLYCNFCRWDSADVGIVFDKPTGLAVQLQKYEDSAPDTLEFERLKEHFEQFIRVSNAVASNHPTGSNHMNSITAAASSVLSRDIPGVAKYSGRKSKSDKHNNRDEVPPYRSRFEAGANGILGQGGGENDVSFLATLEDISEVQTLEQRSISKFSDNSVTVPSDLRPLRIPLHSKKSKRCPSCRHILIKPEQKAQSVKYKIKLVAVNYLPAITVTLPSFAPPAPTLDKLKRSLTAKQNPEDEKTGPFQMQAGKTYPFHIALTNPLYDLITVKLSVQRTAQPTGKRPAFAVSLPAAAFPIAAYAEAWEYEDDDEMFDNETDDIDELLEMRGLSPPEREVRAKTRNKTVGVLEKKANTTVIGGEVVIGKDGRGDVKFNMLVSYTYRSDDIGSSEVEGGASKTPKALALETKTFSFYTVVDLGVIVPKDESGSNI
ncbi:hypothetical protein Clacol_009925 [Clathrus columnatus]|uniref:Dynactin subunit 4 n=1 Tax=Clathrus columnatus TaxID=1419009 RepID=A0AAV5ALU8_9AGAM|nr:hypothetical protein Clacol_009925 [Clathrus columnatus]